MLRRCGYRRPDLPLVDDDSGAAPTIGRISQRTISQETRKKTGFRSARTASMSNTASRSVRGARDATSTRPRRWSPSPGRARLSRMMRCCLRPAQEPIADHWLVIYCTCTISGRSPTAARLSSAATSATRAVVYRGQLHRTRVAASLCTRGPRRRSRRAGEGAARTGARRASWRPSSAPCTRNTASCSTSDHRPSRIDTPTRSCWTTGHALTADLVVHRRRRQAAFELAEQAGLAMEKGIAVNE